MDFCNNCYLLYEAKLLIRMWVKLALLEKFIQERRVSPCNYVTPQFQWRGH